MTAASSRAPGPNGVFFRHPAITGLVLAAVLLTVVDLGAGSLAKRRRDHAVRRGTAIERSYRRASAIYHHDLVPMVSTDSAFWGDRFYQVRTNSLGFKDARTRQVPADSAPKVLLIGDSFTEGIGVPFEATFAGLLAKRAAAKGVDVLNASVASYSPLLYWRKIANLVEDRHVRVDEVIAFIDISDIQDETLYYMAPDSTVQSKEPMGFVGAMMADSAVEARLRATGVRDWVRLHSLALYPAATAAYHLARPPAPQHGDSLMASCANRQVLTCRGGWTTSPAIWDLYGREGMANARAHADSLSQFLRRHRIPLTVVVYPWRYQVEWNDRHSRQSSMWADFAARTGDSFVDLFPPFFAEGDARGTGDFLRQVTIPGDVHWNARGHAFVDSVFRATYCAVGGTRPTPRALASAICPR